MNKKELQKAFEEGIINEFQYKDKLFEIETAPKVKQPKRKLPVCISIEEFKLILKKTKNKRYKLAFFLGWMSGLRISEAVRLEPPTEEDYKYKRLSIKNAKGGKDRSVPMPKGWKRDFEIHMPLNKNFKNEASAVRCVQIAFKRASKRAGVSDYKPGIHFHSLRHGFATHALDRGMGIHDVRTLMGHANISTTNIYLEANPKKAITNYQDLF